MDLLTKWKRIYHYFSYWNCRGFLPFNNFYYVSRNSSSFWTGQGSVTNQDCTKKATPVRTALHGSGVHPVSMDFGLAHPILQTLGFEHDGSYRLILALNKWDVLTEEQLTEIDKSLLDWWEVRVQPTRTKEAGWKDQINWYIQRHWSGGTL